MATYTGTIPSGTLAAGAGLSAAWTQQVGLSLTALESAWTSYTPTVTGFTLGNGTVAGRYMQIGKFVAFSAQVTFGTTTTAASASPTVTLPVSAVGTNLGFYTVVFTDTGTNSYQGIALQAAAGTVGGYIIGSSGLLVTPTTTTPFTWGSTDVLTFRGIFEAA